MRDSSLLQRVIGAVFERWKLPEFNLFEKKFSISIKMQNNIA
jgi:hypothetical protein